MYEVYESCKFRFGMQTMRRWKYNYGNDNSYTVAYVQWWANYFVKVTELQLQLLGKKVTQLQLPFWKSN